MADSVKLSSLRISLEGDASSYTKMSADKIAADQKMVASGNAVAGSITTTDRVAGSSTRGYESLKRSYLDGYAASQSLASGLTRVQKGLDVGAISAAEAAVIAKNLQTRYSEAAAATLSYGAAHVDAAAKVEGLREKIRLVTDAATGNFAGLARSGTMVANSYGLLGAVLSPVGLSIAAVGAAAVLVGMHLVEAESETRNYSVALQAMGNVANISAEQLRNVSRGLTAAGASSADAQAVAKQIALSGNVGAASAAGLGQLALDISAGRGVPVSDAMAKLLDIIQRGFPAILSMDSAWNVLSADQLMSIRIMGEHGDKVGVVGAAMDALHTRMDGLKDKSITPLGKAFHDLGTTYDDLLETLSKSPAVGLVTRDVQQFIKDLGEMVKSIDSAPGDVLRGIDRLTGRQNQAGVSIPLPAVLAPGAQGPLMPGAEVSAAPIFGPANQSAAAKSLGEAADAQAKLTAAMNMTGIARQFAMAGIEAEKIALDNNYDATQTASIGKIKAAEVSAKLAGAIGDENAVLGINAKQSLAVAGAYLQSSAAGQIADAQHQAALDHFRSGVDVQSRAQALLIQQTQQVAITGAHEVATLELQAAGIRRVADASAYGTAAIQKAILANQVADATLQQRIALDVLASNVDSKSIATKQALASEIDRITQALTAQDAAQKRVSINSALERQQDQLTMLGAETAAIDMNSAARAIMLIRLEAENELRRQGRDLLDPSSQAYIKNAVAIGQVTNQLRQQEAMTGELANFTDSAFTQIGADITQAFQNGDSAARAFQNITKNVINSLITEFEKLAVINPLENLLFPGTQARPSIGGGLFGGLFSFLGLGGGEATAAEAGTLVGLLAEGGIMTSRGLAPLRSYSAGGVASTAQVAIYGEGARPEAFVPLPDGRRIPVAMQGGSAANANASGDTHNYYNIDARNSTDPAQTAVLIDQVLAKRIPGIVNLSAKTVQNSRLRAPRFFGGA